jgi:hypothetical protein
LRLRIQGFAELSLDFLSIHAAGRCDDAVFVVNMLRRQKKVALLLYL